MKQNLLRFFLSCLFMIGIAYAQDHQVSGTVTSASDGTPLSGVSITVQGTSTATQTDDAGRYSISVSDAENAILVFTNVGYLREVITVSSRTNINVSLGEGISDIEEVVVTAYGTQTKESIAGSISTLSSDELSEIQSSNVIQSLSGKVGGVQIRNTSGLPGSSSSVRFRGIGSISTSNEPLYVVDGVPFNGDVASIPAQDIDQMSFLKDAAANALYGSRGANGVILITTKKGKGETKIHYESRVGYNSRSVKDYEMINDPIEYYEQRWERLRLGSLYEGASESDAAQYASDNIVGDLGYNIFNVGNQEVIDPATGRVNPNASVLYQDDWNDALFKNSVRHEHTINIQQGGEKFSSYLSGSYLNDEGYVVNSGFDRISSRLNLEYKPYEPVKLGANVNFASTKMRNPQAGKATNTFSNLFMWTRSAAPIYPIWARNSDGSFRLDESGNKMYDWGSGETLNHDGSATKREYISDMNPYGSTMEDVQSDQNKNLSFRGFASIDFLKYFNFTYNLGYDYQDSYRIRSSTAIGGDASTVGGRITNASLFGATLTNQQLLTFKKQFDDHNLDIMVGHESSDMEIRMLSGGKSQQVLPGYEYISNYSKYSSLNGYNDFYKVEGYLSRVNYDYLDRYFVNASFRRDGSSVFHPDNRWGSFFGLGGAWVISKENFMNNNEAFSHLKFKMSYGEQGNDNLYYPGYVSMSHRSHFGFDRNYTPYKTQYEITPDADGNASIREVYLGNEELKWEVSRNFNTGFEVTLYNKVNVDIEFFQRAVSDMLFNFPQPPSSGSPSISRNVGNMRNRGLEITADADVIRNTDLNLNVWANATTYKNKITSLPEPFVSGNFRFVEGESAYTYYMREYAGVNPENGNGQWYVGDRNDNYIAEGEKTTTETYTSGTQFLLKGKTAHPDLYGGFGFALDYKNFSISAGFSYQIGGYIYDHVYSTYFREGEGFGNSGHSFHKDLANTWTPENTGASLPMVTSVDRNQFGTSDMFLTPADYLSFENFSIAYSIPTHTLKQLHIQNARISLIGNNLGVLSKRRGLDPRMMQLGGSTNNGLSLNSYSLLRSLSLGLSLNF